MGVSSNRFYVTSIKDGTVVNSVLYSTHTLAQMVTASGVSIPDWRDTPESPKVYCVTRTGATLKPPTTWTWKLGSTTIIFDDTQSGTISSNCSGAFVQTTESVGGQTFPAIGIIKNISQFSNNDNNVITCSGTIEFEGAPIEFSVSTTLRKSVLTGTEYYGWVDGDAYVTSQTDTAHMVAHLQDSNGFISDFFTEWNIEGSTPEGWPKTDITSPGQCYIAGSEFTDFAVIRVDYYEDSTKAKKLYTAFWNVDDLEDEEQMYICSFDEGGVQSGLDVSLRYSQQAQFVAWMGKNGDQTSVDARYTVFKCKLMDGHGNTILNNSQTGSIEGITAGDSASSVVADANGWFDITARITSPVTATGGKVIIPASFADAHYCKLTGIISASESAS